MRRLLVTTRSCSGCADSLTETGDARHIRYVGAQPREEQLAKGADIHSETVVITSSGSNVVMQFDTDGKASTHAYVTDGKERVIAEVQGGQNLIKAYWKKSSVVVETFARLKMPNTPGVNGTGLWRLKDRWTLSGDGRVLTDEAEGFDAKTVSVYDKR